LCFELSSSIAVFKPVSNNDKPTFIIPAALGFLPEYLAIASRVTTLALKMAPKLLEPNSDFCFLSRYFYNELFLKL
jgi:hypothetical protein